MSDAISIHSFRQARPAAQDDASILRVSKHTGDVTTRPHGLLSRLVRFIGGPTNDDIRNNKVIVDKFIAEMRAEFGPQIARQALLHASIIEADGNGGLRYQPGRPLTARTVAEALNHADAAAGTLTPDDARKELTQREGELPAFRVTSHPVPSLGDVLNNRDVGDPTAMTRARLKLEFAALRVENNIVSDEPPNVDRHMAKLDRTMAAVGSDDAEQAAHIYGKLRETVSDFAGWIAGGHGNDDAQAVGFVDRLRNLNDDLILTGAIIPPGDVGGQDRLVPIDAAVLAFARSLSPAQARDLSTDMAKATSRASTIMMAFDVSADQVSATDPQEVSAHGHSSQVVSKLIGAIDRRGTEPGEDGTGPSSSTSAIEVIEKRATQFRKAGMQDDGLDALADALLVDVRAYARKVAEDIASADV